MVISPHRGLRLLLPLLALTAAISIFVMPFLLLRPASTWIRDSTGPLRFEEHYAQLNSDIPVWVLSTAQFPYGLREENLRINRPVYLAVQSVLPRLTNIVLRLPDLRQGVRGQVNYNVTMFWMLALNVVFVGLTLLLFLGWTRRRFGGAVALVAGLFFVLSPQVLNALNKASPEAAGLLISILTVILFDRWLLGDDPPSWRTIGLAALAIGLMMLVKGHYHILFFCWLWCLLRGRWRALLGTLVLHLVPLLAWIALVELAGLEYYNHEAEHYRQGVWVFDYLAAGRYADIYLHAQEAVGEFAAILAVAFTPVEWALALGALLLVPGRIRHENRTLFALLLVAEWAFMILIARAPTYLVFDLYLFVYPFAAVGLLALVRGLAVRLKRRRAYAWLPSILAAVLVVNVVIGWRYHAFPGFAWEPAFGTLVDALRDLANDLLRNRLGLG